MTRPLRLLLGMIAGNAGGALAMWIGAKLSTIDLLAPLIGATLPSLLFIPFLVGLTAGRVWKPLDLTITRTVLHSITCTALGLLVAALIFREGIICLLIISPLFYAAVLAGALTGRIWFRRNRGTLNLCLAPVIVIAVIAEPAVRVSQISVVTDDIRIAAVAAKVWPHLLAFKPIPDPPNFWLFHLGLPYPVETTNGGNFIGAERSCRFSGGANFKETIAAIEPRRRLTFDIVEMPRDPELMGHLDALRGEFELRDNGDGTTTLIGRTWYSLRVRPAWYFDWWTHHIFSAVHLRVMQNVRRLAETER